MAEPSPFGFRVRPIRASDLESVVAMVHALAAYHGDSARIDTVHLSRNALGERPWIQILVAETEGGLVGYASFVPFFRLNYGERGLDMNHLYVEADWRACGVGKALVGAGVGLARGMGCEMVTVGTASDNHAAQAFYQRQGFTPHPLSGNRFRLVLD